MIIIIYFVPTQCAFRLLELRASGNKFFTKRSVVQNLNTLRSVIKGFAYSVSSTPAFYEAVCP